MITFNYVLALFAPGEAERITGVDVTTQRDWRRRGFIAETPGTSHARFDLFDLAELYFLRAMADHGIGPQRAKTIADLAAGGIAFGALTFDGAYEGDAHPLNGLNLAANVIKKTAKNPTLKAGVMPARFLIIWADGKETWASSVDTAIDGLKPRDLAKKLGGPVIVLDQFAIGKTMLDRAGRALVQVERIGK